MKKRILALALALSLLLTSCGGGASAATMRLKKAEGTVGVSDDEGKGVEPREDLGLYSGYGVDTQAESYAWIDLDSVKLTKLDQDSEIAITKEGKKLVIEVKAGSLFFNVSKPLTDDETMNVRTSTMLVGIRGTCGWVTQDAAALLEGAVEVTAGEQAVTISAGEMAYLTEDRALEVKSFYREDIPAFVSEENLEEDILAEVSSLYPLTVLTKQTLSSVSYGQVRGVTIEDHFYDEKGYTLRKESQYYQRIGGQKELMDTSTTTYSYDGKGRCVFTDPNGNTHETNCVPGTFDEAIAWEGCFSDPLVSGDRDDRSKIGPDGRLEIDDAIHLFNYENRYDSGYYAIYTMDAGNYPIHIDTYSPDGILTGMTDFEWAVIDP